MQIWASNIDEDSLTKTNDDEVSANNVKQYSEFGPSHTSPDYFVSVEEGNFTSSVIFTPKNNKPVLMVMDQRNTFETPVSSSQMINESK